MPHFLLAFLAAASCLAATSSDFDTLKSLKADLSKRRAGGFDLLLNQWETRLGSKAVAPLLQIAADRRESDADRYIALMGAARLGGTDLAPVLTRYLDDKSWMIRSGALRVLRALGHPSTGRAVLPLLRDPALVVRSEAVETVEKLRPPGSEEALLSVLEHPANYHAGKAQWIARKALRALVTLKASGAAPRLRPLLSNEHGKDPQLQAATVEALEALTGKTVQKGASLAARVQAWDKSLAPPAGRSPASSPRSPEAN